MLIASNLGGEMKDAGPYNLDLRELSGSDDGSVLMYGINCTFDDTLRYRYINYRRALLNLW